MEKSPHAWTTVPMCYNRGDGRTVSDISNGQWTDAQWTHGGEVFPAGTMVVIVKDAKSGDFDRQELGEPGVLHPVGRPDRKMKFLAHEVTREAANEEEDRMILAVAA